MGKSSFTDEANDFLKENWNTHTSRELSQRLWELFGIRVATQTVTDQLQRLGIHRGKRYHPEGYTSPSCKPIGTERIEKGRTVMVKVAEPNKWMPKAVVVMGYDPNTHQAIFLDGNSLNVTRENIVVVSKNTHARLAKNGWLNSNNEVLLTGIKWCELQLAIKNLGGDAP